MLEQFTTQTEKRIYTFISVISGSQHHSKTLINFVYQLQARIFDKSCNKRIYVHGYCISSFWISAIIEDVVSIQVSAYLFSNLVIQLPYYVGFLAIQKLLSKLCDDIS